VYLGLVLGLFNMSALGLRAFSGITVGLVGAVLTIHVSLALSCIGFIAVMSAVWRRHRASAGGLPGAVARTVRPAEPAPHE
jgi:hypothetical protein